MLPDHSPGVHLQLAPGKGHSVLLPGQSLFEQQLLAGIHLLIVFSPYVVMHRLKPVAQRGWLGLGELTAHQSG